MKIDYDLAIERIDGSATTMREYQGKVLLIVNTASECGFTPQFDGLEKLWQDFGGFGFAVLGFPCNQFGGQDPGENDQIASFCRLNYGVSFPMHAKIEVNGDDTHPLFQQLKAGAPGLLDTKSIKWNFTKFLVGADGAILERFGPKVQPTDLRGAIEAALKRREQLSA